jgi:hypothetical protein
MKRLFLTQLCSHAAGQRGRRAVMSTASSGEKRRVLIFGKPHLRRVLTAYSIYYNEMRTHLGLSKDAPLPALSSDLEL